MKSFLRRIRFSFRFIRAFLERHKKLILLGFVVGLVFFLYFPKLFKLFLAKDANVIGIVGRFTAADLPEDIQKQIGDGLTTITEDGQIAPSLAKSWEINNDGQEYIFTLDRDRFWNDHTPLLAKDIDFNFSDVTTTAINDDRVKFELKEPFAPFLSIVARPVLKNNLVGTGEYKVSRLVKNGQTVERLTLTPAKDNSKKKIVYRFYPTEEAAVTAFKLGEINTIDKINNLGDLRAWENVSINEEVLDNRFVALFFDTQNQKFADKSIRQGLAYAIEKRWEPRALTPINPKSWAYNNSVKPYNYDLDNAKKLLESGSQTSEGSSTERLTEIELSTIPSLLEVAEGISKDWEKLGIKTKVKAIVSLDEPYEALLVTQEIPADPDQYVYWHSTQAMNLSHYKSPKIDKLLEDGRKTFNLEQRKEVYLDFQRFLVEDTPVVFLFHPTIFNVSRK